MKGYCNNFPSHDSKIVVVATHNENKFFEIRAAFGPTEFYLLSLKDFPEIPKAPETGETFAENALQKANFYYDRLHQPILAEDSGLVIPALDGFPGVSSARIAPDDASRVTLILDRMKNIPESRRMAYYVCSLVFRHGDKIKRVEGRCDGVITLKPRGSLGFGYDPIFRPEGTDKTFGQMSVREKSQYSHRGKAVQKILPYLLYEFRSRNTAS